MSDEIMRNDDEVLEELRSIRADLSGEQRWRKALTKLVALQFVIIIILGLLVSAAYTQRHEQQKQNDKIAALVNSNDYESCIRINDGRSEIRGVLTDLITNYVSDTNTAQSIVGRLNDPTSPLAPRDCSVLPH